MPEEFIAEIVDATEMAVDLFRDHLLDVCAGDYKETRAGKLLKYLFFT
jgi:hypothetical protein